MMEDASPLNIRDLDSQLTSEEIRPSHDDVALLSVAQKAALFKSKMVVDEGLINESKVKIL